MNTFKTMLTALLMLGLSQGCKKTDKPGAAVVITAGVTGVTATGAQVSGSISSTGNSPISQSGVCWALQSNPTIGDSIVKAGQTTTGAYSVTLANLNANTVYYVRAYAINATGTGYGNVDSFMTSPGLATVQTTTVSNIVPFWANSGGTITNSGGSNVIARGICWSVNPHPTTANSKTMDSSGVGAFSDSIGILASQTVYYVRAFATNGAGTAYGNEVTFTSSSANTVSDIDGNVYPYVQIGSQYWMTVNLKTTRYQNGDPIINGLMAAGFNWLSDTLGAYTFPNGDSTLNPVYGKLYNSYAVDDARNACPVGWHVPTDAEWQTMELTEGMPSDSVAKFGYRGMIGPKLTVGGSSGLNLQNGGFLLPGTPPAYYDYNVAGFYICGPTIISGTVINYYRAVDLKAGNPGPIYRQSNVYSMSVRCVKN